MIWSYHPETPAVWALHRGDRRVASVCWLHDPEHLSVTMTRLVDRLNLPADQCAPSATPTWSVAQLPCTEGTIPGAWSTFSVAGVEVLVVVWDKLPSRLAEWQQRILDALDAGRGLPAVRIPNLPPSTRSEAA